jgi:hypothetical protein
MGEPIIMLSTAELDLVSYYSFAYDHDGRLVSVEEYYSESPSQPENEFVKERHWTIKWEDGMCLENVLNWIDWMNFGEDDPLGPIFPLFDSQRQNG